MQFHMRAVNPFGYNRNSEKLCTEANIFATYIYKIYYISRNAGVYILVDIEYSYLHIYTLNARVFAYTRGY